MTTTSRSTTPLSVALVALLVAACAIAGAGAADAAPLPRSVPMVAVFDGLMPGDSASRSWTVDVPRPALITDTAVRRTGESSAFRWHASLCPAAGGSCVDLLHSPDGTQLPAGTYRLGLGVTVVAVGAQSGSGSSESVEGHLTFVERPTGSLASTGSGSALLLLLSAAAIVAVGVCLLLAARRRRPADQIEDLQ
jgi:hypothetical protein